jgi:hypothetical protein
MGRKSVWFSAVAIMVVLAGLSMAAAPADNDKSVFTEAEYRAHLKFLADDLCEGRAPGTRGGDLAALYIATQFEAAGLRPISEKDGYFQQVPMQGNATRHETVRFTLSAGANSLELAGFDEVVIGSELPDKQINLEGDLLFVGYGIEAPEYGWDDYKGADVRGKILVMLVNDPDLGKTGFGSESLTYYGRWTYKEEIARIKGAAGLILLHTDQTATYPFTVVQASWGVERCDLKGTVLDPLTFKCWVSRPAIDKALAFVGLDYAALKEQADSKEFEPIPLGISAAVAFEQDYREFESPNVIGILPGTDLADEAILYMAHYDHFGIGHPVDGDAIYNGATDNASGTAAIICLARAFAQAPEPPHRSIIFMATTGEERGLLGSEYYSARPVMPLEKTIIALNKDCCNFYGLRDGISAFPIQFTDATPEFEQVAAEMGLKLVVGGADIGGGAFRVDNFPLCARGVVGLSIGTAGKNLTFTDEQMKQFRETVGSWYHQPNDEIYPFWSYEGIIQELNILYKLGSHYAAGAPPPTLNPDNPYIPAIRIREMKYSNGGQSGN